MSKTCNSCGTDKNPANVPYVVHESTVARMERIIKRQWIALIVAICMIVACNCAWLYAWMQYDYTSEEVIIDSQDGGNANYIGNDGDIINGTNNGTEKNTP
jgi:hypothetical protein